MALKDWKKQKSINPYKPYSWINKKKGLLLVIHYDIGFGKQRNVTVYNYKNQIWTGYQDINTFYCESTSEALRKAKEYMKYN